MLAVEGNCTGFKIKRIFLYVVNFDFTKSCATIKIMPLNLITYT